MGTLIAVRTDAHLGATAGKVERISSRAHEERSSYGWLAVEAVIREPLSARAGRLLPQEQGNFLELGGKQGAYRLDAASGVKVSAFFKGLSPFLFLCRTRGLRPVSGAAGGQNRPSIGPGQALGPFEQAGLTMPQKCPKRAVGYGIGASWPPHVGRTVKLANRGEEVS